MKLLIKQFRRVGGRYRMARAIFDWSRGNTKQNNVQRKTYLAVLKCENTKFRAGYVERNGRGRGSRYKTGRKNNNQW